MKACVLLLLMVADGGVSSMRVIVGEPKGVPSARVPGEKLRPAAFIAAVCATKLPPDVPTSASGERVNDWSDGAGTVFPEPP